MKKQLAAGLACLLLLTVCASAYGGAGNRTAGDREGPQLCQSPDWRGPERSL